MTRRPYGSGSKREIRPGVWELRAGGRSLTFHGTAKQAEKALGTFAATASSRAPVPLTLGALLDQWTLTRKVERSTADRYDAALKHLPDTVRAMRLDKLSLRTFDQLYAELDRQGVGPQSVRKLHVALSSALTQAVRWRIIEHHPARGAILPAIPKRNVRVPEADALAKLFAKASVDPAGEVWLRLALALGARRGEVLALRWSQVNLKTATVSITRSLQRDLSAKSTKGNAERDVSIDAGTVAVLRRWKALQRAQALEVGVGLMRDPFVLSTALDGSMPWRPDGASQRFKRLRIRAGVPDVRLHDLRHAHASMLLRDGVDVKTVSGRLGHARASMTLDVYGWVMDGSDRAAAEVIGRALG